MSIDKVDIALHIGIGLIAISIVGFGAWYFGYGAWGFYVAAGVNAIAWPVREMAQHDGHDPWSLQKHLEAWPSGMIGGLVALAGGLIT